MAVKPCIAADAQITLGESFSYANIQENIRVFQNLYFPGYSIWACRVWAVQTHMGN